MTRSGGAEFGQTPSGTRRYIESGDRRMPYLAAGIQDWQPLAQAKAESALGIAASGRRPDKERGGPHRALSRSKRWWAGQGRAGLGRMKVSGGGAAVGANTNSLSSDR